MEKYITEFEVREWCVLPQDQINTLKNQVDEMIIVFNKNLKRLMDRGRNPLESDAVFGKSMEIHAFTMACLTVGVYIDTNNIYKENAVNS